MSMNMRSSRSMTPSRGRVDAVGDSLQLGVKARLSNQEMEQLKQKLAQAVAYDHVDEDKRAARRAKPASQPMTRLYHKVVQLDSKKLAFRSGIKTQASIAYEQKFTAGCYDAMRMRPPPKGIPAAAKSLLQDEYVTRPREISVIPNSQRSSSSSSTNDHPETNQPKPGKRLAPAPIPQVFIM